METLYRKDVLKIVDRCFHMYASDFRNEAREYATEILAEIPDATAQLKSDKAELLEALEDARIAIKRWDDELSYDIYDLIQKHKQ